MCYGEIDSLARYILTYFFTFGFIIFLFSC